MARQAAMPQTQTVIRNIFRGPNGEIIAEFAVSELTLQQPDDSILQIKESMGIQTADGLIWNPSMMGGSRPIPVGVCELCREEGGPPVKSLVTVHGGRHCVDCGTFTCPRHRKLVDDEWRCPSCAASIKRSNFLRSIFYRRKDK